MKKLEKTLNHELEQAVGAASLKSDEKKEGSSIMCRGCGREYGPWERRLAKIYFDHLTKEKWDCPHGCKWREDMWELKG